MNKIVQKIKEKFFDQSFDFRVRLFHVLALGGVTISILTAIISLITGMWGTASISGLLIILSLLLIYFILKTGRYNVAYFITIVVIFMIFMPMMFFTSGGHSSGMPSIFLFAVMFTVLMLKGKAALIVSVLEIIEYAAVCIFAYHHPEYVTHYETEGQVLFDVIFAFTCISLICGIVLFLHLREYDRQRELLSEQNEKLKRYDASRSAFLTTVSHEIKNPLNAINLHACDTLELMDTVPFGENEMTDIRENQQVIEKMVVRIDRILTDLKDTVAIEQGRLSLSLAPMRLKKLIREVSKTYFGKNNTADNELILNLSADLPPINADRSRLTQVITNILANSIKHTKGGKIVISLYRQQNEQIVEISDDGEGMNEEIREKVFKGYVSASREYWRHGIGLYVSHQIIEAHGGRIWIDSQPGHGTTVTFALPEPVEKEEIFDEK